ncbi:MAG: FecR family protein [Dysgonomonas sp.]
MNLDIEPLILAAIASVLNGNPSDAEKYTVDNWLQENPKNKIIFDYLSKLKSNESIVEESEKAKEKIYCNIQKKVNKQSQNKKLRIWQYAATIAIIVSLTMGGLQLFKPEKNILANIETKCPMGITSSITLSDGTIVDLNAGSSLEYPAQFDGDIRMVSLKGEAYFRVAKDTKHPFIVETNGIRVKVLGTHFNVQSYENDDKIVATLVEGSISVDKTSGRIENKKNEPIILQPNQQITFDKSNSSLVVKEVDANLNILWRDRQYYFDNEKFADIVKKLERNFNVKITIASSILEQQEFSGAFTQGENLEQILNLFKKYRNFDYKTQENNDLIIFEK